MLDDPAAGVFVDPQQRGVGVVFQDHRLFPHLRVLDNVAFGAALARRARGRRRASDAARVAGPARASASWPAATRGSCPAGRRSGSRWPGRWPASRRRCCSTSRSPRSTCRPGPRCRASCASISARSPARRCSSRTTRSRRCCWPPHRRARARAGRAGGHAGRDHPPAADALRRAARRHEPLRRHARAGGSVALDGGGTLVSRRRAGRARCSPRCARRRSPCTPPSRRAPAPATSGPARVDVARAARRPRSG